MDISIIPLFGIKMEYLLWHFWQRWPFGIKLGEKTLYDALDDIYREYGLSEEKLLCLNYEGKAGAEKIERLMEHFRKREETSLCGQKIERREDYQSGLSYNFKAGQSDKMDIPSSNVLGFCLEGGSSLYLRPSGTEPKIKFYIMIQEHEGTLEQKKVQAANLIRDLTSFIEAEAEGV